MVTSTASRYMEKQNLAWSLPWPFANPLRIIASGQGHLNSSKYAFVPFYPVKNISLRPASEKSFEEILHIWLVLSFSASKKNTHTYSCKLRLKLRQNYGWLTMLSYILRGKKNLTFTWKSLLLEGIMEQKLTHNSYARSAKWPFNQKTLWICIKESLDILLVWYILENMISRISWCSGRWSLTSLL